jgi:hypothetical protein
MSSHESPTMFLTRLAPTSGARWRALGAQMFAGEISIATANSVYRFHNGVFVSRAKKPARFFDAPKSMRGVRLIGFLSENALSVHWTAGASAVLWNGSLGEDAFIFTSATIELTIEEPEPKPVESGPKPSPWHAHAGARALARPLPASMTRLHNALPVAITR